MKRNMGKFDYYNKVIMDYLVSLTIITSRDVRLKEFLDGHLVHSGFMQERLSSSRLSQTCLSFSLN